MEITFEAFAADCIIRGILELGADRLSDHLNAAETVELRSVALQSLEDGHIVNLPELAVPMDDLCAVVAAGPRGVPARRVHRRSDLVEIRVGPYLVIGDLQLRIGAALHEVDQRHGAFVAVTEARVVGPLGEGAQPAAIGPETVLVNRALIVQITEAGGKVSTGMPMPARENRAGSAREIGPE